MQGSFDFVEVLCIVAGVPWAAKTLQNNGLKSVLMLSSQEPATLQSFGLNFFNAQELILGAKRVVSSNLCPKQQQPQQESALPMGAHAPPSSSSSVTFGDVSGAGSFFKLGKGGQVVNSGSSAIQARGFVVSDGARAEIEDFQQKVNLNLAHQKTLEDASMEGEEERLRNEVACQKAPYLFHEVTLLEKLKLACDATVTICTIVQSQIGRIIGTGVLIPGGFVLTCMHNISR
jgi:hypothetical protein